MNLAVCLLFTILIPIFGRITPYTEEQLAKVPPVNFAKANASKSDVSYFLFKNSSQTEGLPLAEKNTEIIDKNLQTKVFLHGFTTNPDTSPWFPILKNEYFKKGPHNIIYVDWSRAGNLTFEISAANVDPIGEFIADRLINLQIPVENIHVIGHSLGSHVAGFVGKHVWQKTGKKIARITAPDPGGPGFHNLSPNLRLSEDDAIFVDVIHTDIGYYGMIKPIGHVDYYPNGGKNQPGCPSKNEDDNCSHARSLYFFGESILNKNQKALPAKLNEKNEVEVILCGERIVFGDSTPITARGCFYFETNSQPPFLQ